MPEQDYDPEYDMWIRDEGSYKTVGIHTRDMLDLVYGVSRTLKTWPREQIVSVQYTANNGVYTALMVVERAIPPEEVTPSEGSESGALSGHTTLSTSRTKQRSR